jgi:hypothetical protein
VETSALTPLALSEMSAGPPPAYSCKNIYLDEQGAEVSGADGDEWMQVNEEDLKKMLQPAGFVWELHLPRKPDGMPCPVVPICDFEVVLTGQRHVSRKPVTCHTWMPP